MLYHTETIASASDLSVKDCKPMEQVDSVEQVSCGYQISIGKLEGMAINTQAENMPEERRVLTSLEDAKSKDPPKLLTRNAIRRHYSCLIVMFCSISIGFNGTLLNSLLTNSDFRLYFSVEPTGTRVGIMTAMYQLGAILALPFLGLYLDKWGRRLGIFTGAVSTCIGAIIQSIMTPNSNPFACYMAGRMFLGFGFAIMTASAPIYIGEIAHPSQRGIITAIYSTFWLLGSILASAITGGMAYTLGKTNSSWIIPIRLQLVFPGLLLLLIWTLPESPRWQYTHNQQNDAKDLLIYYHGEGKEESVWVRMQLEEYETYLEVNGSDKRWWDFKFLFERKATRRSLTCACVVAIFGQCSGNGALSNFISGVLGAAAINNERQQMNINLGLSGSQFFCALLGSLLVDKSGRRTLLIFSTVGLTTTWAAVVVAAAVSSDSSSSPASHVFIALIFIFSAIFAAGFTPVQALYPSEVLPYEVRAKGMAVVSFGQFAAALVNQFVYAILLAKIGWKLFIFFTVWCLFQLIVIFIYIPETKNVTLERMEDIFQTRGFAGSWNKKSAARHNGGNQGHGGEE